MTILSQLEAATPKYTTVNELFRDLYSNNGIDAHQQIHRLVVSGNVELLVEVSCLLFRRYPNLKPGPEPDTINLDEAPIESIGSHYAENKIITYLGLNKGYITQTISYPGLFFSLCCGDNLDVVDYFRIMRMRTDWTDVSFKQAWLDSEFRHYKQWFVNTMIHIPPAQYHFYFFAKLIELLFRPVYKDGSNNTVIDYNSKQLQYSNLVGVNIDQKLSTQIETNQNKDLVYGDILLNWLQPQVNIPDGQPVSWATDIFGPFDAKACQEFITSFYQRAVDSCIAASNYKALSTLLSAYHWPDVSTPPESKEMAPRRMTRSGKPYEHNLILEKVNTFLTQNQIDLPNAIYEGKMPKNVKLSTVLGLTFNSSKNDGSNILNLPKTVRESLLEARPVLLYLHLLDCKNQIIFYENLKKNVSLEAEMNIITLETKRDDLIDELERNNKDNDDDDDDDDNEIVFEIKNIVQNIEEKKILAQNAGNRFDAYISSYENQLKNVWDFLIGFLTTFGFNLTYSQDIIALQAIACCNNDVLLAQLLTDFDIPFANDLVLNDDKFEQFFSQIDEINQKNNQNYKLHLESGNPAQEFSPILSPSLLTLDNVIWQFTHRDHQKGVMGTQVYLKQLLSAIKPSSLAQNVNHLTLSLLSANLTPQIETLMKYFQQTKLITPKAPPAPKEFKEEAESGKKKGGKGDKSAKNSKKKLSPEDMMAKMMGGDIPGANSKSPTPLSSTPVDDESDDDLFGKNGVINTKNIIVSSDAAATEPTTPVITRKFININDLSMETNYIAHVVATYTTRASTLKFLLNKKAKLYSNSRGNGPKSNAFLMCLVSSFTDPESRDEMLTMLFDYCGAGDDKKDDKSNERKSDEKGSDEKREEKVRYSPGLSQREYYDVLNQIWTKSHVTLNTIGLLPSESHLYQIYQEFNIFYEEKAELYLHTKRLAPKNLISGGAGGAAPAGMAAFERAMNKGTAAAEKAKDGGKGKGKGGAAAKSDKNDDKNETKNETKNDPNNDAALKLLNNPRVYLDALNESFKFDFFATTVDLSLHAQPTESYLYHHKRHVAFCDFAKKNELHFGVFSNFDQSYALMTGHKSLVNINDEIKIVHFDIRNEMSRLNYKNYKNSISVEPNFDNNYYGYFGHADQLDPEQRGILTNSANNTTIITTASVGEQNAEDLIYMRSNPFKNTFFSGFFKDLCLLFTHILFGEPEHRVLIGSAGAKQFLTPFISYALHVKCQPLVQFFINFGYVPNRGDLEKCIYNQASSLFLQDINFQECFMKIVNRKDLIGGFKRAIAWKRDYAHLEIDDDDDDDDKDGGTNVENVHKDKQIEGSDGNIEQNQNIDDIDDIDAIDNKIDEDVPFDPFASDDVETLAQHEDALTEAFGGGGGGGGGVEPTKKTEQKSTKTTQTTQTTQTTKTTVPVPNVQTTTTPKYVKTKPLLFDLPTVEDDLTELFNPFSLHKNFPFRKMLTNTYNPVFQEEYPDDVIHKRGFNFSYADEQEYAKLMVEMDIDFYVEKNHQVLGVLVLQFCQNNFYYDALQNEPEMVQFLQAVCGAAYKAGVPGAGLYDIKYLFKNPNKEQQAGRGISISLNDDPIEDYQPIFLLECLRLLRLFQSYFKSKHSALFSPSLQCFLTLVNAIPDLDEVLMDSFPTLSWGFGSSLLGYVYSLSRSDPLNYLPFVRPLTHVAVFYNRYNNPTIKYNLTNLIKMMMSYIEPHMQAKVVTILTTSNLTYLAGAIEGMLKEMERMVHQFQSNPMSAMMAGGQAAVMQQLEHMQAQVQELAMDSLTLITTLVNSMDSSVRCVPAALIKSTLANPILMFKAIPQKYIVCDLLGFYRLVNNELPCGSFMVLPPGTGPNGEFDINLNDPFPIQCRNKHHNGIDLDALERANDYNNNPYKLTQLNRNPLQPSYYLPLHMQVTFFQMVQLEDQKQALDTAFQARLQKCKSEKEAQALSQEFQQQAQPLMMQEQAMMATLLDVVDIRRLETAVGHGLQNDDVAAIVTKLGFDDIGINENGQILNKNQIDLYEKIQKSGKIVRLLLPFIQNSLQAPELVHKHQGGWFKGLIKSGLVLTCVAAVASGAYFAMQYWNGSMGRKTGMLDNDDESKDVHSGDVNRGQSADVQILKEDVITGTSTPGVASGNATNVVQVINQATEKAAKTGAFKLKF
jgi:hypothetical protein